MKTLQMQTAPQAGQRGFTIIELVVVILLLGILAATALPRFIDVTDEAHDSVVNGVAGGLRTGVALYRAEWVAEGAQPDGNTVGSYAVQNLSGYPGGESTAAIGAATDCVNIYDELLQAGRPDRAEYTGTFGYTGTELDGAAESDFNVHVIDNTNNTEGCAFIYTAQDGNDTRALIYTAAVGGNSGDLTTALSAEGISGLESGDVVRVNDASDITAIITALEAAP